MAKDFSFYIGFKDYPAVFALLSIYHFIKDIITPSQNPANAPIIKNIAKSNLLIFFNCFFIKADGFIPCFWFS